MIATTYTYTLELFCAGLNVIIKQNAGAPTAGQSYNLTCTVRLKNITGRPNIGWLDRNNNEVSNGSNITVENRVTVNDSAYERTLVFSSLRTSHGGQYICKTTLGQASAMTSTNISVQSAYVIILCTFKLILVFSLQFHSQRSPSHPIALVFSMLALPSPSPAPFS